MGRRLNRDKMIPPPLSVKFLSWEEWDTWHDYAKKMIGTSSTGSAAFAGVTLLRVARSDKALAKVRG